MDVIVVGCGRVGGELSDRLYRRGHQVTVVDENPAAFDNLPPDFRGRTVEGNVLNQDVLRRAGIERAEGLAAVTNSDALNAVVARVALSRYQVANVVARNFDPRWRPLHETLDLQVVSSASWGAQRLEELLYQSEITSVFSAGNGEVQLYELTVPASGDGQAVGEFLCESRCLAVAHTRAGRASLPGSDTVLQAGDILLVSATPDDIRGLRKRLTELEEKRRCSS
jgi:trk system potassium uptake protein TrkA